MVLTGLSKSQTMITVIQQPTPLPTVARLCRRIPAIQTIVNGIDHIETKAILPEHLVVDQLDAIKEIADNGTLIAQQRFAVRQYKIKFGRSTGMAAHHEKLCALGIFILDSFYCLHVLDCP